MNCNQCARINPMPQCVDDNAYSIYYLAGLVFASTSASITMRFRDTATGRVRYQTIETDELGEVDIDIFDYFPLIPEHIYELSFFSADNGSPASFTITNPDGSTESRCCLDFAVQKGWTDQNDVIEASTITCTA